MAKIKNLALFFSPLLILTLFSLLYFQRQGFKNSEQLHKIQAGIDSIKMEQFYSYVLNYGGYISVPLRKEMLVSDSSNKYIKIKQLIDKKKYVYHFDETNCFTCVEKYLPFLKKLSLKAGNGNVIILGSYEKKENLFLTLHGYDLKDIPVYNINPAYLRDTKLGEINTPYIFEMDSSLQTKQFYIPEKSLPNLSELYDKTAFNH